MTNRTQAFGRRILGALRNENILIVVSTSTGTVTLINAKTDKPFYTGHVTSAEYDFAGLISFIKALPSYPQGKERKVYGRPSVRHTQTTGVSMGRFVPGLSMGMGE